MNSNINAVKSFYNAYVKLSGGMCKCFKISMGVCQGCVMSPYLFYIFMDGHYMR